MKYIAFLYKDSDIGYDDKDHGYNVVIPDVEGANTCGDDFTHSIEMAKEVLELSLDGLTTLPEAHELSYFTPEKLKELDIPVGAISIDIALQKTS